MLERAPHDRLHDRIVVRSCRRRRGHSLGRVRRVTLFRMAGEWKPSFLSDYDGTRYSFRQHLADGHQCHRLAALGDNRNDEDYYLAPDEARPIFLAVLLDCLAPAVV